jgi:hypothetical protein
LYKTYLGKVDHVNAIHLQHTTGADGKDLAWQTGGGLVRTINGARSQAHESRFLSVFDFAHAAGRGLKKEAVAKIEDGWRWCRGTGQSRHNDIAVSSAVGGRCTRSTTTTTTLQLTSRMLRLAAPDTSSTTSPNGGGCGRGRRPWQESNEKKKKKNGATGKLHDYWNVVIDDDDDDDDDDDCSCRIFSVPDDVTCDRWKSNSL